MFKGYGDEHHPMVEELLYPSLAVKYLHSNKNELVQLLPHPHCV